MIELGELFEIYKDLPEFVEIDALDVNTIGNFGDTPLHVAASRGVPEEIQRLIEAGANVNAAGELGNSPLHEAVGQDNPHAAEALLNAGATVKGINDFGESPIEIARRAGRTRLARLLEQYAQGG